MKDFLNFEEYYKCSSPVGFYDDIFQNNDNSEILSSFSVINFISHLINLYNDNQLLKFHINIQILSNIIYQYHLLTLPETNFINNSSFPRILIQLIKNPQIFQEDSSTDPIDLALDSFYLISIFLYSKYPMPSFSSPDFISLCVSAVMDKDSNYRTSAAINILNLFSSNPNLFPFFFSQLPPRILINFVNEDYDYIFRGTFMDLVCSYSKFPLSNEDNLLIIQLSTRNLLGEKQFLYRSSLWSLLHILKKNESYLSEIVSNMKNLSQFFQRLNTFLYGSDYDIIPTILFFSFFISYKIELTLIQEKIEWDNLLSLIRHENSDVCQAVCNLIIQYAYVYPPIFQMLFEVHFIMNKIFDHIIQCSYQHKCILIVLAYKLMEKCPTTVFLHYHLVLLFHSLEWLDEFDNYDILNCALAFLNNEFEFLEKGNDKDKGYLLFMENNGNEIIQNLKHSSNLEIVSKARSFEENHLFLFSG